MSFRSKAQMRLFARDPKLRKYFKEWFNATPNPDALPEKVAMNNNIILKAAASAIYKSAAVVKKKGAVKRTGKSVAQIEKSMKRTDAKQSQKKAGAGGDAAKAALLLAALAGIVGTISKNKSPKSEAVPPEDDVKYYPEDDE